MYHDQGDDRLSACCAHPEVCSPCSEQLDNIEITTQKKMHSQSTQAVFCRS